MEMVWKLDKSIYKWKLSEIFSFNLHKYQITMPQPIKKHFKVSFSQKGMREKAMTKFMFKI